MSGYAEKMRRARESKVTIGGHGFTVRRPTQLQIVQMQREHGGMSLEGAVQFYTAWDFTELDLGLPGGTGAEVPFEHEALQEWVADHPEHWADFIKGVTDAYQKHQAKLEEDSKNS